ncbi:MAG: S24/S26 family peptidase [Bdellovibrionales bacterium]|nr:S24/S26 family peptidase [Bdellovibrionales bacterium]
MERQAHNPMKVICVQSESMAPYLRSNDVLVWESCEKFTPGDLVVLKNDGNESELLVHRYIGEGLTKGDCEKWDDKKLGRNLQPLGRVVSRLSLQGDSRKAIVLNPSYSSKMRRLIVFLSRANNSDSPWIQKMSGLLLGFINLFIRYLEDKGHVDRQKT